MERCHAYRYWIRAGLNVWMMHNENANDDDDHYVCVHAPCGHVGGPARPQKWTIEAERNGLARGLFEREAEYRDLIDPLRVLVRNHCLRDEAEDAEEESHVVST